MTTSLRIVVADDEPDMREFYQSALPRLGHVVAAVASNGRELVECCRAQRPDLVIADIKMPELDGIDAAGAICRDRPVPIILVSAHCDRAVVERAESEHIMGFLVKPVRLANLGPAIAVAKRRFDDVEELAEMSFTDELTGLHNRRGFLFLAEQQMKIARRMNHKLSLLFIDVDGLKRINDTFGHQAGDRRIQETAEVLRQTFRGSDILGRLGGDEFAVLVIDDPGGAEAAVARLMKRVDAKNASGEGLSLSVGAGEIAPEKDCPIEEALARADEQMYIRKKAKSGDYRRPVQSFGTAG